MFICTKTDTLRIQSNRAKSILDWRHPESQAEAGSRMPFLFPKSYSSPAFNWSPDFSMHKK